MNQDHHDEQMEALRADFERMWKLHIEQGIVDNNLNPQTVAFMRDVAWKAFKYGKVK